MCLCWTPDSIQQQSSHYCHYYYYECEIYIRNTPNPLKCMTYRNTLGWVVWKIQLDKVTWKNWTSIFFLSFIWTEYGLGRFRNMCNCTIETNEHMGCQWKLATQSAKYSIHHELHAAWHSWHLNAFFVNLWGNIIISVFEWVFDHYKNHPEYHLPLNSFF